MVLKNGNVERVAENSAAQTLIAKGFKPVNEKPESKARKARKPKEENAEGGDSGDGDREAEETDRGKG